MLARKPYVLRLIAEMYWEREELPNLSDIDTVVSLMEMMLRRMNIVSVVREDLYKIIDLFLKTSSSRILLGEIKSAVDNESLVTIISSGILLTKTEPWGVYVELCPDVAPYLLFLALLRKDERCVGEQLYKISLVFPEFYDDVFRLYEQWKNKFRPALAVKEEVVVAREEEAVLDTGNYCRICGKPISIGRAICKECEAILRGEAVSKEVSVVPSYQKILEELQLQIGKPIMFGDIPPCYKLEGDRIVELDLRWEKIQDLSVISKLKNLRRLSLSGCSSLKSLEGIENLERLEILNIDGTQVSDLTPLENLRELRILYMRHCKRIKDIAPLIRLKEKFGKLSEVYISGTPIPGMQRYKLRMMGVRIL